MLSAVPRKSAFGFQKEVSLVVYGRLFFGGEKGKLSVLQVLHACLWFSGSSLFKNLELEQLDFKTKHMG